MQVEAKALKGLLHMLLLAVLAERPLHGWAIIDALKQAGGDQFAVAERAVYAALHRLEHLGLITSSTALVGGHTRRTYVLTPAGRDKLSAEHRAWEEFAATVRALVAGGAARSS